MRAKFIAPARREFLKEVGYYNEQALGLGATFAQEVEDATARAWHSRIPVLQALRALDSSSSTKLPCHTFCKGRKSGATTTLPLNSGVQAVEKPAAEIQEHMDE